MWVEEEEGEGWLKAVEGGEAWYKRRKEGETWV